VRAKIQAGEIIKEPARKGEDESERGRRRDSSKKIARAWKNVRKRGRKRSIRNIKEREIRKR